MLICILKKKMKTGCCIHDMESMWYKMIVFQAGNHHVLLLIRCELLDEFLSHLIHTVITVLIGHPTPGQQVPFWHIRYQTWTRLLVEKSRKEYSKSAAYANKSQSKVEDGANVPCPEQLARQECLTSRTTSDEWPHVAANPAIPLIQA